MRSPLCVGEPCFTWNGRGLWVRPSCGTGARRRTGKPVPGRQWRRGRFPSGSSVSVGLAFVDGSLWRSAWPTTCPELLGAVLSVGTAVSEAPGGEVRTTAGHATPRQQSPRVEVLHPSAFVASGSMVSRGTIRRLSRARSIASGDEVMTGDAGQAARAGQRRLCTPVTGGSLFEGTRRSSSLRLRLHLGVDGVRSPGGGQGRWNSGQRAASGRRSAWAAWSDGPVP